MVDDDDPVSRRPSLAAVIVAVILTFSWRAKWPTVIMLTAMVLAAAAFSPF